MVKRKLNQSVRAPSTPRSKQRHRASTRDVLAGPQTNNHVPARWKKHHENLLRLRDHLLTGQNNLSRDAKEEQPAFSLHMADAGTDNFDRDFALSQLSQRQEALYEIESALSRISNGGYGVCELTGKKIEAERLDAIPWARFTAEAERELERRGEIHKAKLGPRETVTRMEGRSQADPED